MSQTLPKAAQKRFQAIVGSLLKEQFGVQLFPGPREAQGKPAWLEVYLWLQQQAFDNILGVKMMIPPKIDRMWNGCVREFCRHFAYMLDAIVSEGHIMPTQAMMLHFEMSSGLYNDREGNMGEATLFGENNHTTYMVRPQKVWALAMIAELLERWYHYPVLRVHAYESVNMRRRQNGGLFYVIVVGEANGLDVRLEQALEERERSGW